MEGWWLQKLDAEEWSRQKLRTATGRKQNEDDRRRAVLFNDIAHAKIDGWLHFGDHLAIRDYLWSQGWRRDVRPEDVTER